MFNQFKKPCNPSHETSRSGRRRLNEILGAGIKQLVLYSPFSMFCHNLPMGKMKSKYPLYLQLMFTILAFFAMIVLSHHFTSDMMRRQLVRDSERILDFEKKKIEAAFHVPQMLLDCFSETIRYMILQGDDIVTIKKYVEELSTLLTSGDKPVMGFNGIYGWIETLDGKTAYIHGADRFPSEDYDPRSRPWYQDAVKAEDGAIIQTSPYWDVITKKYVFTFARCIYGEDNRRLGVTCLTVAVGEIGKSNVVDTAIRQGAVGMLIDKDLTIIAHNDIGFVGKQLDDPEVPISIFADAVRDGMEFSGGEYVNYRGENSVSFSRKLSNGWYLVFVTPKKYYYQSVTSMALIHCVLGTVLAAVLMGFLIRIDAARNKADKENRLKSSFLANMSHEIRTPLNAIVGMTILGKTADGAEHKDYCFNQIEEASQHLLGVINDILDISKIEANKFELSVTEFRFERMLQQVVNFFNHRIEEKRQKLMIDIDKTIPKTLVGDDQRLAQVITNLLGNAIKFTPEEGAIRINANLVENVKEYCTLRIAVTDTGIGINHEQQGRIFDVFQQADSQTSRQFGGTGLGLVISKNIVEMMGGQITVESEPGNGATFVFTVQLRHKTAQRASLLHPDIHWNNVSIMVIDDDPATLEYFKDVLQRFDVSCDTAVNGREALELIKHNGTYNIYFMDWRMPDIDSITLAKMIKEKSPDSESTIVMMIAVTERRGIEEEANKIGINKFLAKPLFPSVIMDIISKILGVNQHRMVNKKQTILAGIFAEFHILLAEDVVVNSIILQRLLEPTGVKIDCAKNGAEAVRLFRESPEKYDLIFMDIQMPVMDGYEATRNIRALHVPRAKTIPIIAMTANVFREDVEECFKAGMNNHLGKPLNFDDVLGQLHTYLHKR